MTKMSVRLHFAAYSKANEPLPIIDPPKMHLHVLNEGNNVFGVDINLTARDGILVYIWNLSRLRGEVGPFSSKTVIYHYFCAHMLAELVIILDLNAPGE